MMPVSDQIEAVQREIADLEKKLAYKKSLLPGLMYAARQGKLPLDGGTGIGQMRLRLGKGTEEVLEYLVTWQNPRSSEEIQEATKQTTKHVRYALRNLLKRKLVSRIDEDRYAVTESGMEFYMKYKEKQ